MGFLWVYCAQRDLFAEPETHGRLRMTGNNEQIKADADATEYADSKCGSGLSDRSVPWEPPKLPSSECSLIFLMLEKGAAVQQIQSQLTNVCDGGDPAGLERRSRGKMTAKSRNCEQIELLTEGIRYQNDGPIPTGI
jgi:hypothetical protein